MTSRSDILLCERRLLTHAGSAIGILYDPSTSFLHLHQVGPTTRRSERCYEEPRRNCSWVEVPVRTTTSQTVSFSPRVFAQLVSLGEFDAEGLIFLWSIDLADDDLIDEGDIASDDD